MRRLAPLWIALALAGCSGDTSPVPAEGGTIATTVRDYRYSPQHVSARPGRIVFRVTNRGRLAHNFHVRVPKSEADRLSISSMLPGESGEGAVRLKAGEYRMYCAIGNHEELGEWGTLVVRR
jgi:plastocyanin